MISTVKPFAQEPGRNTAADRVAPFDIAQFYYDQRLHIAEDLPILRKLIAAVDRTNDLGPAQWAQWYSVALGFAPDLIIELGRGRGNSTALFAQAARRLGKGQIVSLCRSDDWAALVAPRIEAAVEPGWFDRIDARRAEILSADFETIIGDHQRVLLLWDAHGFEIAELVLGEILPRLVDRDHLLLMHDISDNRYAGVPRSYGGQPLWKGSDWQQRTGTWDSRVNIGWMNSIQDQVIALADFTARNDLEIGSADHEYSGYFAGHPERADEMRRTIGDEFFSVIGHWAFLSLSGKAGPFHFPSVAGRNFTGGCGVTLEPACRLPASFTTAATPWSYARTFDWRPVSAPPAHTQAWIRCRVHVEGGAIGISMLTPDGNAFVESRIVTSTPRAEAVLLSAGDLTQRGRVVIHTWDTAEAARVRIDEMSLVW
jgi:hypothetical protein